MSISSRSIKISPETMACVSLRSSLRILWTAVAALVFLTRSSAAPTFGGADKAMVSQLYFLHINKNSRNANC